ncbi:hypothetical protein AJ79_06153 [Helicocarpus griseus UAMH5409]|uniref:HNH nuclease domain-containing protein n=1 Tax=Helicocarpus griseus UAMH5409 TaxID=1447875 RepID=A0A2B7XFM1_9EURO|nr:hypothetical protein AJ79_06153 [Helicocarpus griseus UAMH5409]
MDLGRIAPQGAENPPTNIIDPSNGPDAEFMDPLRQTLIDCYCNVLGYGNGPLQVSSEHWALFWLSDTENLESLVAEARVSTITRVTMKGWLGNGDQVRNAIIKPWNQTRRCSSTCTTISPIQSPANSPSSRASSSRSRQERNLCSERDKDRCVFTHAGQIVHIAHICPFSISSLLDNGSNFWALLGIFWREERIDRWKRAIFTRKCTEVCQNLVSLSPSAHAYWDANLFALKPLKVSSDKKSLTVQLFWLHPHSRMKLMPLEMRPFLPSQLEGSVNNVKLFNCVTHEIIQSGHRITICTDDPDKRPLPSYDLLEMQWYLHRVSALAGASEVFGFHENADEDDDGVVYSD